MQAEQLVQVLPSFQKLKNVKATCIFVPLSWQPHVSAAIAKAGSRSSYVSRNSCSTTTCRL